MPNTSSTRWLSFKTELSALFRLGAPLVIAHLCVIGMGVTDTIMAGRVSPQDLAGLAVGAGIWSAVSVLIIGLMSALAPIIGHHLGAGDKHLVAGEFQQNLLLAFMISVPSSLLLWYAPNLLTLRDIEPSVAQIAGDYLQILAFATPAIAIAATLRNVIETFGQTRISMFVNVGAFLANILLDAWFVFGGLGLEPLGGTGCALATGLLSWVIVLSLAGYLIRSTTFQESKLFSNIDIWHWPRLRHQLYVGVPIAIGASGEVLFFGIMAWILTPLGAIAVGAHQIAQNFGALIYMIPLGMSQAVAIRVARAKGSGNISLARYSAWCGVALAVGFATVSGGMTFLGHNWIALIYTDNLEVIALASRLLLICALYQLFDAVQIMAWGGLRGYKDTRFAMAIQLIAYWLVGFPLGYSLSFTGIQIPGVVTIPAQGVEGLWWGVVFALGFAAAAMMIRLNHLTRPQVQRSSSSPS